LPSRTITGNAAENVAALWTDVEVFIYDGLDAEWTMRTLAGGSRNGAVGDYLAMIRTDQTLYVYDVKVHDWVEVSIPGSTTGGEAKEQFCVAWGTERAYGYLAGSGAWDALILLGAYVQNNVGDRLDILTGSQGYVFGYSKERGEWETYGVDYIRTGTAVSKDLGMIWGTTEVTIFDPVQFDSDGDGMADWWEDKYGFEKFNPLDAFEDADGDGKRNYSEFLADTDPKDSNSLLRMEDVVLSADLLIRWQSVAGVRYRIEVSENMTDWRTVSGEITALENLTEWRDSTIADIPMRFYRAVVIP
jgi:hypothetical protein